MSSLPIDLTELLHGQLRSEKREDDELLHCSSDLVGSLRHTQLRYAKLPIQETDILSDIRLNTGTMWHSYFEKMFAYNGLPVMTEVNLTNWLPDGWSGRADWLIWNPAEKAFTLVDLKTTRGEGISFIREGGAKDEHLWQGSAYHMACVAAGLPMTPKFVVYYLPMNSVVRDDKVAPLTMECTPIESSRVVYRMLGIRDSVNEYIEEFEESKEVVNGSLAPPTVRHQAIQYNSKMDVFDLKLTPHWLTKFCPYDLQYCDCSTQRPEKIGHWTMNGDYVPRAGYAHIEAKIEPTSLDYNKRRKK